MRNDDAKYYAYNKVISAVITIVVIYIIHVLFKNDVKAWLLIIGLYSVFGQGHFITTYFYLLPALKKKLHNKVNITIFISSLLALVLLFVYWKSFKSFGSWRIIFIGGYFIFHNTINEKFMLQQSVKIRNMHSWLITFFFLCVLLWIYAYMINTPSFSTLTHVKIIYKSSFTDYKNFLKPAQLIVPEWAIAFFFMLSALVLAYLFFVLKRDGENKYKISIALAAFLMLLYLARGAITNIGYVNFLGFVIIYHYITWFLFYFYKFRQDKNLIDKERNYILINVLVYASLIGVAALANITTIPPVDFLYVALFSLSNFLLWTFVHITITFISEPAINKMFLIFK